MLTTLFQGIFHVDHLSMVMTILVSFIGLTVSLFAARYLRGDKKYYQFFRNLTLLIFTIIIMVAADHLALLLCAFGLSNLLLIRLMIHKPNWEAARQSGLLAGRTFFVGFVSLAVAFAILYYETGQTSVQVILQSYNKINSAGELAAVLIFISALSQSAILPFHRWLVSSLNSPTPVSAIMHAGLVNGGGFLLVRFAPFYIQQPTLLTGIFIFGLITALIGTLWKLIQQDVKRMLASSTMAQMGFMFLQCGLGLFPAAVAHLCWHGLFKAHSFLASNSAINETRYPIQNPLKMISFLKAILCGIGGLYVYSLTSKIAFSVFDTRIILLSMVFIALVQFALRLVDNNTWKRIPSSIFLTAFLAGCYGYSLYLFELFLSPLDLMHPQPMNILYYFGLLLLVGVWFLRVFPVLGDLNRNTIFPMLYVKALNTSQPHPATITSNRNQYQF